MCVFSVITGLTGVRLQSGYALFEGSTYFVYDAIFIGLVLSAWSKELALQLWKRFLSLWTSTRGEIVNMLSPARVRSSKHVNDGTTTTEVQQ